MSRLCVIASPSLADGFRLAGVEVHPAETAELARAALLSLVRDEDVGMVAIESEFYDTLDARTKSRLDDLYRPVVIAIPAPTKLAPSQRRAHLVSELINRAIGIRITVRGPG